MIKVLFITEKYHSNGLPTNNMHNLIGSWESTGYGQYEHLFIDPEPGCIWSSQQIDEALLTKDYDVSIISVYHHLPSQEVAEKLGHKIAIIFWDAIVSMGSVFHCSSLLNVICVDHGRGMEYPDHPKVMCLEVPQDTRIFYPDETVEKDIDVSFVGSMNSPWPDRRALVEKIRNSGINIWFGGGRGVGHDGINNLSVEEYAKIHKRSKICLNLSYGHGRPQRKGRVFEIAACKGFMMSNRPETMKGRGGEFFGEGTEFVSFNENDVIEKIKYYLEHKEERELIAYRMHETYRNNFSPKYFYNKVLSMCGISF